VLWWPRANPAVKGVGSPAGQGLRQAAARGLQEEIDPAFVPDAMDLECDHPEIGIAEAGPDGPPRAARS